LRRLLCRRGNFGMKVEPMADIHIATRRWMLPMALVAALMASFGRRDRFGGSEVISTYMRNSGVSGLRRCPTCKWVELCPAGEVPWCEGVKRRPHSPIKTVSETSADVEPSRGKSRFYYPSG
jgi:hypothetical protein